MPRKKAVSPTPTKQKPDDLEAAVPESAADIAYTAKVDHLLEQRDQLESVVARLMRYPGNAPTEIVAQQKALDEYGPQLDSAHHELAVMRGDFLPGDPSARKSPKESIAERGARIIARSQELKAAGVKAWQKQIASEESRSQATIKKWMAQGRAHLVTGEAQAKSRRR